MSPTTEAAQAATLAVMTIFNPWAWLIKVPTQKNKEPQK